MNEPNAVPTRQDYGWFLDIPTRWRDNDAYGHMNNALYYTFFETIIMHFLEQHHGLDSDQENVRCFTVENGCRYHDAIRHPAMVQGGLRVERLGNSSVRYGVALFVDGKDTAAASGFFTDVFVDSDSERPRRVPDPYRRALSVICVDPE